MKAIEGWGLIVSPEWLQSLSTGIVFLVLACWIVALIGRLQREALWSDGVHALAALGTVEPLWAGWRVCTAQGAVECRGGLRGVRAVVVAQDGSTHPFDRLPSVQELGQLI